MLSTHGPQGGQLLKNNHCSKPGWEDWQCVYMLITMAFCGCWVGFFNGPWKAMWPPWVAASWSIQQNQPNTHANMIFQQLSLWKHVPPPCHFRPPRRESYQTALQHAPLFWQTSLINLPSESFKKNSRILETYLQHSQQLQDCQWTA